MKRLRRVFLIILAMLLVTYMVACAPEEPVSELPEEGKVFSLKATITEMNSQSITVNVTESDAATGTLVVLLGEQTKLLDEAGQAIAASALGVGDKVEISYNGQMMKSFPPQIMATVIKRVEKQATSPDVESPDEETPSVETTTDKPVLLVSIDGLRPDALMQSAYADWLTSSSTYYLAATTVYPSVTLPCHMSMQHGVQPSAHGVTTNTYTPAENLTDGIAETLAANGKACAFFYNWGPLGSVIADDALVNRTYLAGETDGWRETNQMLGEACADYLAQNDPDFTFLYLGYLDEMGHVNGWLSPEYYAAIDSSLAIVKSIVDALSDDYVVIVTTDHGGHDYSHGSDLAEDMTIPIFIMGDGFASGVSREGGSILDIAPTVATIAGVAPQAAWEGNALQ